MTPDFLKSRKLDVSIDTTGFCQARCEHCVWPAFQKSGTVQSLDDFATILARFDGYAFGEFAFNSINEPFADRTILDKLELLIERGMPTDLLFFSSNWLLPKTPALQRFADAVIAASEGARIAKVSINATISGIDQASYDILQAGRDLENAVMPYKTLDFDHAVANVLDLLSLLEARAKDRPPFIMRLKCYGFLFDERAYRDFWMERLLAAGLAPAFIKQHVRIHLNHGFTSFARHETSDEDLPRRCSMNWLDKRLVIGPRGHVGLCCHEGAHQFSIGNLLTSTLEEVTEEPRYQSQMRILKGLDRPGARHLCRRCEFYVPDVETVSDMEKQGEPAI